MSERSGKALSGMFAATDSGRLKDGRSNGQGFVSDPMDFGTPDAGSVAPRMYTQDSYREDPGSSSSLQILPQAFLSGKVTRSEILCESSLVSKIAASPSDTSCCKHSSLLLLILFCTATPPFSAHPHRVWPSATGCMSIESAILNHLFFVACRG